MMKIQYLQWSSIGGLELKMGVPPNKINHTLLLQLSTTKPVFVDVQSWKSKWGKKPSSYIASMELFQQTRNVA